ncbi:DUF2946 domain-containing protein [Chromohalobacter israelensis]|jgi:hypothetical protein|uniref:DUF2946 domain-containing protein n=1 Tax=Chromohalobacter israelensis (strain ATCC BAA-138 / DSM 3043 / CIP 106854 / NCIMB 13768 / 1H11) TaxID=290398 RepID=Q1R144_CHRI1|nr:MULTISPECIES: DUF2946 domain-containing protein [Chromohalobacter]ABE57564.1 conserved hypothetical protein [Chromohalobacter salexigens DSM 3043]MBZ5876323.1 DUF2946 domain-containing protein [Chromohalobacter salexigens]MDF9434144.1 DUF2946 domain-containing protein [Chromohalobacter israelensis]MDO0945305.1 DUF2946 domain-containing protein [Chromohalobacter salexigens]PWW42827.1 hypothetical protein DFO74_101184 [Chromohalobacter salexigens]
MPFSPRTSLRRVTAWLSLFAMLLVVCGPVVGQASASLRHDAMPSHAMMHAEAGHGDHTRGGHVASVGLHDQCLYCSLFGHFPVLEGASTASMADNAAVIAPRVPRVLASQAVTTTFPNALTRAPPYACHHA